MRQNQKAFYFFTFSFFLFLIFPSLLRDGMFMDGVLYATVAKNLASGIGDFWNLKLTETLYPLFQEHPPLAFGLQSIFFKVLGSSYLVERIYSFTTFIVTAFLILKIWKLLAPNRSEMGWLPIFLWFCIPLTAWSASNNMLENTLMIFTSLSAYYILKHFLFQKHYYLILAAVFLLLGVLTKGLVALFPLAIPFIIFIFKKEFQFQKFVIISFILTIYLLSFFAALFLLIPESFDSLLAYFNNQIVGSLKNIQTVDSRFFIIFRLLKELIPIFVILILLYMISYKKPKSNLNLDSWFFVMIAIGLSAVIPIMISMKQSGFYINAAFPFFALGFAYLIKDKLFNLLNSIKNYSLFTIFSKLLLICAIILNLMQIGKIGRDENKLIAVYSSIEIIPKNSIIGISDDIRVDWSLNGYFYRYGNISLDAKNKFKHTYYFSTKNIIEDTSDTYKLIQPYNNEYYLYKKK